MKLSETLRGIAWLGNFSEPDRTLAARLLDAMILDGWTRARADLLDLLRRVVADTDPAGAVWMLPIMDEGDIRRADQIPNGELLTAFVNFHPGMPIPSLPGSEGLIGHVLRDIEGPRVVSVTASLPQVAHAHVRTIVLVTDTIETGSQVVKYARALIRNKTVRSWSSSGWVKFVVVSYAASVEGAAKVRASGLVEAVNFIRQAPTIRSLPWAASDIAQAVDLCTRYGRGGGPLGYGSQGSLFGFRDRVPNTVPRIFRQSGPDWQPLFVGIGGRQVPTDVVRELPDVADGEVSYDELVINARQERLALSISKQQRDSNRDILATLSLLRVSPGRADALGIALGLEQSQVDNLLRYLEAQGWVTPSRYLTDAGVRELVAGKRKPRRVTTASIANDAQPYYPESLR